VIARANRHFRVRPCLAHHPSLSRFQKAHREWVEPGLSENIAGRNDRWSESIAVGSDLLSE